MQSTLFLALLPTLALAGSQGCQPDFKGRGVSVLTKDGYLEMGHGQVQKDGIVTFQKVSKAYPDLYFDSNGDNSNTYTIRPFAQSDLAGGLIPGGNGIQWVAKDQAAKFTLSCDTCSSSDPTTFNGTFAQGCTVSEIDQHWCALVRDGLIGENVRILPCEGKDREKFDFFLGEADLKKNPNDHADRPDCGAACHGNTTSPSSAASTGSQNCQPNFKGRGVSVLTKDGYLEMGHGQVQKDGMVTFQKVNKAYPDLYFDSNGDANSTYTIRPFAATDLVGGLIPGGNGIQWAAKDQAAKFTLSCDTCSSSDPTTFNGTFAQGCTLSETDQHWCALVRDGLVGENVRILPCEGKDREKFDFFLGEADLKNNPNDFADRPDCGTACHGNTTSVKTVSAAFASDSEGSSDSIGKWATIILSLVVVNLLVTLVLAAFSILGYVKRGGRDAGPNYAPVKMRDDFKRSIILDSHPYRDEERYSQS